MPMIVTVMVSGPRVVSPPTSATPCRRHRSPAARANSRQPGLVGIRQRQRQQRPGGLGTHGRDVGEVHREGPMADGSRRRSGRKMHAFDQRIGDRHQLARSRRHQHRAVITHADAHVAAFGAEPREVSADELELGLGHVALRRAD